MYDLLKDEKVDVILLDYHMPYKGGFEILKELKQSSDYQHIPIVMLTNETDEQIMAQCFEAGAQDFLSKPIRKIELRARIESVLSIAHEKARYTSLLENIFPKDICEELVLKGEITPRYHPSVTVGFTDFVNFTSKVEIWQPEFLISVLKEYFSAFDQILEYYKLEKLKTIGDAYMFAGGVPDDSPDHAIRCAKAACQIRDYAQDYYHSCADKQRAFELRIGLHSGPVVSGVISGRKIAYDIWGDTVNTAQRMESSSHIGTVCISEGTYSLIKDKAECEEYRSIEIKGKGMMKVYTLKQISSSGT